MKIQPITTGIPEKTATDLLVRIMPIDSEDIVCQLYYQVKCENGSNISDGNIQLTEEEFEVFTQYRSYVEDLALTKLNLQRLV